jgi:aldehyde dehydrogenase (NAD+)
MNASASAGDKALAGEPRLLINGRLTEARSGARYPNINPATEELLGTVADAGAEDAAAAVAAARRAFDESGWSTDRALRHRCLAQLRDGLRAEARQLHAQIVAEVGATLAITANGGPRRRTDGNPRLLPGPHAALPWEGELPVTHHMGVPSKRLLWREAAGVVAAITPWNFPFQINIAKIRSGAGGRLQRGAQGGARDAVDGHVHRPHCRATDRHARRGPQRSYLR